MYPSNIPSASNSVNSLNQIKFQEVRNDFFCNPELNFLHDIKKLLGYLSALPMDKCYPSVKEMAKDLEIPERTLYRHRFFLK